MKLGRARLNLLVCHTVLCAAVFAASSKDDPSAPALQPMDGAAITNNSELLPIISIRSLTRERAQTETNLQVHIRGVVLDQLVGQSAVIRDNSGSIYAKIRRAPLNLAGERVDAWGKVSWDGNRVQLLAAVLQLVDQNTNAAQTTVPAPEKPAQLPVLTTARQVLELPPGRAAWHYPVHLRAVVTYSRENRVSFCVQDGTAGIFVRPKFTAAGSFAVGDEVEIEGISDPGSYAPVIEAAIARVIGRRALPEPQPVTLYQLATGRFDSQWVEVRGVVRSVQEDHNVISLNLNDVNGVLRVSITGTLGLSNLADSVVRIRGVCGTSVNANRELTGVHLMAPSTNFMVIEEPGFADPFAKPAQAISSLAEFGLGSAFQHRIKIAGIITFSTSEGLLFVQDATGGVPVYLSKNGKVPQRGDHIEVAGYPSLSDYGHVFRDALCRVTGPATIETILAPQSINAGNALDSRAHGRWVQMDARLVSRSHQPDRDVLTLQTGTSVFEAIRPVTAKATEEWFPSVGSLVRLRGVYSILGDESRQPRTFRLYLPPTEPIQVMEKPSWWNARHALTVLEIMTMIILITTLWVFALRRQVQEQTAGLRQSELKFRSLVEQSLVGVYIIQDGRFAYVNPRLAEIYGYTPEEMLRSCTLENTAYAEDLPLIEQQIQRRIANEVPAVHYNFRGRRKDGSLIFVEVLGSRTEYGGKPAIVGTLLDITERKRAERGLAEASSLLEAMLDNCPEYIYFKDIESRFVRYSKSFAELLRMPNANGLRGKTDFDIFTEEHARPAYEDEQQIIRTGEPIVGKLERETHADGRITWALTTKLPWRDEAGNTIGTFGISKDVTALKEVEEKLAQERDLFHALVETLPDTIYFKDLESRFVRLSKSKVERSRQILLKRYRTVNPSQDTVHLPVHLTDVDQFAKYIHGKTDFDVYPEERARPAYQEEQDIIRTGQPLIDRFEKTTLDDGNVVWYLTTKMPWYDRAGKIIGTFGVTRNITALKEAEAKLEAAHQRLVETSRLAGMAEVASDVLHNVGNVLNSVNVGCSLSIDRVKSSKISGLAKISALLEENGGRLGEFFTSDSRGRQIPGYIAALAEHLSEDRSAQLKELEQLVKHIDHIKQIVAMQQSYAKVSGVVETVTPVQLVEDALQINAAALTRHDVHLRREFEETPPIQTEKHKVLQILVNLIRNAKYATDESQRPDKLMTIKIGNDASGSVKIQVIDNGVGIPQENLTRIFAHGFTTRRNGHGFGLHSSALAVRELGGSLQAHSDGPGKGATFTLLLPGKLPVQSRAQVQEAA